METVRDLGRIEPWQESLERSRARRSRPTRTSREADAMRLPQHGHGQTASSRSRPSRHERHEWHERHERKERHERRRSSKRSRLLMTSAGGILVLALLAAALPSLSGGRGAQASPGEAAADTVQAPVGQTYAPADVVSGSLASGSRALAPIAAKVGGTGACRPAGGSSGYVNPLARAVVTGERIDQGVDYAGSGTLASLGAAKVTYVATSGTGWPGAFIETQLADGPDRGCYVYYAEGVNPMPGLRVGARVRAGQAIATIIPG